MNRFLFFAFLCLSASIQAQLPPTVHRIAEYDSAVDLPHSTVLFSRETVNDSFGTGFCGAGAALQMDGDDSLDRRPITIELWAKVSSAEQYNIFLAHEPKSSPRHWEIFTVKGTGELAVYAPGNRPDHVKSPKSIADGRWRFIAVIFREESIELRIDGRFVAKQPYNRPQAPTPDGNKLSIGATVEGNIGAPFAWLDNLRISSGVIETDSVPRSPQKAGDQTILLCDFEPSEPAGAAESVEPVEPAASAKPAAPVASAKPAAPVPNDSEKKDKEPLVGTGKTFAQLQARLTNRAEIRLEGSLGVKNGGAVSTVCSNGGLEALFPTGFPNDLPDPIDKPKKNVPIRMFTSAQLANALERFQLKSVKAPDFRPGVLAYWGEQYMDLDARIAGRDKLVRGAALQAANENALIQTGETHPAQPIVRRIGALIELGLGSEDAKADYRTLKRYVESGNPLDDETFLAAAAVRRTLMFSNPKLQSIDRIAFLARASYSGSRLTNTYNSDRIGGHFATQVYGFNTMRGGGLFTIENWRAGVPKIASLTAGRKVVNKRLAGQELKTGAFYTPDISFDGKTLYFSYSESQRQRWFWSPETTWNLFKLRIDEPDAGIEMLTDSAYNDFDVCELPSGRLVFCSERRGGFIRCFGEQARLQVTTAVMHSCKSDGSDIYPISFFETSEWQPSVDNNGMLVYTRWDYTDRENCLGSNFWICAPDGRNPRAPHGNYPFPHHTFADNAHKDHRRSLDRGGCPDAQSGLPMTEMQIRAIPGSHKYVFVAAPHHGETFGSVCLLDLRVPNDNQMSQIRRVTPYTPFPESESNGRSQYRYGAPWPIDEQTYLCNSWEDLIVLDALGNEELVCERELLPINYDPRLRLSEPMPVEPRFKPPVAPQQTAQGEDFVNEDQTATIGVTNVSICDKPLPKDRPIKYLRVLQVVPKPNPWMNKPMIGYFVETTPRVPLGVVPVEPDGSAFFKAPPGKQLLFQTLDENYQAVATMRAVAFVHPGEKLVCTGCHEPLTESVRTTTSLPKAFQRQPSSLQPELGAVEPVNFYRLIQPILDKSCTPCHVELKKGPQKLDYEALRPYVYSFAGGMSGAVMVPNSGGSRSVPGRFGATESKLTAILDDSTHRSHVSSEIRHKFVLWMDANAPRLGAFVNEAAQVRGELVWPVLDSQDP